MTPTENNSSRPGPAAPVSGAAADLLSLTRTLGDPDRDLVILAEGNTSVRTQDGRMLVKASGSMMGSAEEGDFVEVDTAALLSVLDGPELDEHRLGEALMGARVNGGPRPSIEAMLHALCIEEAGASVVGHTHPVAANALLCSDQASVLVDGALFPDQVVVLGAQSVLVPYADPGRPLALATREALRRHLETHGVAPKVVWLANHGLFALGESAREVLQVTEMAVKLARIATGVLSVGRPTFLPQRSVDVLDKRPDEVLRRQKLAGKA
ncbi:class II aldolase/adducin family protein [Goodfellowiella coeruleoviolacea]|uniref:Class II Aldolase and Adducin N-terminal domain-containing protein n=1 Tax=Goodfellowiella coeruleoviolacea TaxID=334858 RepID=A0AAE3GCC4_9PSEU|nr:class II aldolase/adducin family protein [Goodfellowiella coeruleoviolacea]MCP2164519.1 Class II Aldolase and Adducin N-terminal domain-containing protein [Goodfellowiella coeruleoviolacea]